MFASAVAKSVVFAACTAPDGHPEKSPEVETQTVFAPANTTFGSSTEMVVLVVAVFVPSNAVTATV
jgi:hypothetical protein